MEEARSGAVSQTINRCVVLTHRPKSVHLSAELLCGSEGMTKMAGRMLIGILSAKKVIEE